MVNACRDEWMSGESIHESVKDVLAVLLHGRDISANATEIICAGSAAECSGDFLFDFHHAQIAFGQVIGKWNVKIIHKGQDLLAMVTKAFQEIPRFRLFRSSPLVRRCRVRTIKA